MEGGGARMGAYSRLWLDWVYIRIVAVASYPKSRRGVFEEEDISEGAYEDMTDSMDCRWR